MKGRMFEYMASLPRKVLAKPIRKTIIANADSPHAAYFLGFPTDRRITYGVGEEADVRATGVISTLDGVRFAINGTPFELRVFGAFNVMNALPAMIVGGECGLSEEDIRKGLSSLTLIPGRMEIINEGQPFTVVVDYAHEKESMTLAVQAANDMKVRGGRSIVLLGAEGGGRDKSKRPAMGEIVGKYADIAIVCNVDPYDDDPREIIHDISASAVASGKRRGTSLFEIEERRLAIRKALELAGKGDVVMITGKGAEQSMILGSRSISWDDRSVVREELRAMFGESTEH